MKGFILTALTIMGIIAAILLFSAGNGMQNIYSVAGGTITEESYHQTGLAFDGFGWLTLFLTLLGDVIVFKCLRSKVEARNGQAPPN